MKIQKLNEKELREIIGGTKIMQGVVPFWKNGKSFWFKSKRN